MNNPTLDASDARLAWWQPLPIAWMGYAIVNGQLGVRVCGWCPDKAQADAEAERHGMKSTHGICPSCLEKQNDQLSLL